MHLRTTRTAALLALAPGLLAAAPAVAARPEAGPLTAVVVQATSTGAAASAVRAVGGRTTLALPVVDGVAARVPARAVPALRREAGVRAVTPDASVRLQADAATTATGLGEHALLRETGADSLQARGLSGKGVTVAVVDTGIADVPDLAGRVRTVADPYQRVGLLRAGTSCVDLSGEQSCVDSYGHGTFMAGLIAGSGAASGGRYRGIAPGAGLVSVKIGGRDGSADVSKVLAAVQWVVSFKDEHAIRVLNLSLGTDSTAPYTLDPLNHAVQRAWRAGIVVVVSASNRGPDARTISKPADDPLVVTVGAVDDRGTPATSDDRTPAFSGRGPTAHGLAKPDVVAPGARVVGLRSPGSFIEQMAPPGAGADPVYRRGSGTSMSAAVVSGLSALLLEAHPEWTPDRLKHALTSTARKVNSSDPLVVGAGLAHGPAALAAGPGEANAAFPGVLSDASGSIDESRGTVRTTGNCRDGACAVTGGQTAQQQLLPRDFNGRQYAGDWNGSSWYWSQWVGPTGSSWYGSSWYGSSWYGSSWYSADGDPYGASVAGSSWYGVWD